MLAEEHALADEEEWLRRQGPHCPAILEFLKDEGRRFDAVLFYTYIYEPTARGVPIVPERAALISTAHDEAPLRLAPYRALFQLRGRAAVDPAAPGRSSSAISPVFSLIRSLYGGAGGPESLLITRWAMKARMTTNRIGNAALLKKRLEENQATQADLRLYSSSAAT